MVDDFWATQAIFGTSALVNEDISIPDMQTGVGGNQSATYGPNRNRLVLAYPVACAHRLRVCDAGERKKEGREAWNLHFCVAASSAVAANAAVGSDKSATAFLGLPSQRIYRRQPPKMQMPFYHKDTKNTEKIPRVDFLYSQ